jgi:hypothetical protein
VAAVAVQVGHLLVATVVLEVEAMALQESIYHIIVHLHLLILVVAAALVQQLILDLPVAAVLLLLASLLKL